MTRRRAWVLRLRCPCGRNVADVSATGTPPVNIEVKHRAGWSQHPDPGAPSPTYTWMCRCGREHRRQHSRLVSAYVATPAGSVDYLTLDQDV